MSMKNLRHDVGSNLNKSKKNESGVSMEWFTLDPLCFSGGKSIDLYQYGKFFRLSFLHNYNC